MEVKAQIPLSFGRVRLMDADPDKMATTAMPQFDLFHVAMANGTSVAVPTTEWFDMAKFLPAHAGEYQLRRKGGKAHLDWFMATFNPTSKTWAVVPWKETILDQAEHEFRGLRAPVAMVELPLADGPRGRVRLGPQI